jgi:hypothetical protein
MAIPSDRKYLLNDRVTIVISICLGLSQTIIKDDRDPASQIGDNVILMLLRKNYFLSDVIHSMITSLSYAAAALKRRD